jgi:hypothetical protein
MQQSRLQVVLLSLLLLFVLGFTVGSAYAVDVNARIKGTVTDPTGAVVPGASVTATNTATGVKYPTKSLSNGDYLFPQLPVGTYSITVSAPGFKNFAATGITLSIDQEYVEAVKLEVGNATETLEVAADAVQVNTTDMQLSNVVNSQQMVELPLIGRSFTGLELIQPGVQAASDRFTGNYSVSGGQSQQGEYLINGADTNDIALNTIVLTPNLDAIDQFALIDGPLNAEYDRNSGGIISATIKQGTNHFHGDAFEFYRDTFLNTANYFNHTVATPGSPSVAIVSPYHQHIFGGTIGGPVFRDKLFFFGAYQGTRQRVPGGGGTANVYSPAMLGGNFSADLAGTGPSTISSFAGNIIPASITGLSSLNSACVPNGTNTWGPTYDSNGNELQPGCLTVLGGIVPASAFNSVAANLTKSYVPAPNSGTYGYLFNSTTVTSSNQYIGRVDYNLSPKNQITVLGIYFKSNVTDTLPFTGATLPGFGDQDLETIQQYTFDYVHQFNATMVNDFAAHYTRFNYQAVIPQHVVLPSSAGFQITPQDTAGAGLPFMGLEGYFSLGFSTNGPQPRIDQVIQFDDNITKTIGHHSLKFGYDGRRFNVSNPFSNSNNGSFGYNAQGTYTTGDPGLDFLLGVPDTYTQGSGATIQASAWLNYIYAQDNWKATNTLTFAYGLGYSIDTPLYNHQYQGEGIDCFIVGEQSKVFPTAPKNMVFPGDPGCTNSAQAYTRFSEFGPRIGFAWAPDLGWLSGAPGKFSVRGGFGIYFDRTEEESALQTLATPPFGTTTGGAASINGSPEFINPFADVNNGLTTGPPDENGNPTPGPKSTPNVFPYTFPTAGQSPDFGPAEPIYNISTYGPGFRSPYAENFQLSVEREMPSRLVARLSYVGSLARHNQTVYEGNYETAAGHAACVASSACSTTYRNIQAIVYPQNKFGGSADIVEEGLVGSGSASSYNALQASVIKAPTHGLSFQLSYTYAHALDSGSSFENSGFGSSGQRGFNQYQPSLNYGDSLYDARQRLVFAPIYTSPILHGSNWYSVQNLALSGWEVSGIVTVATGFPYDISYAGTTSHSLYCDASLSFYACPDVPVQTGPLVRGSNVRTRAAGTGYTTWFQNTNFAAEPIGSFGNVHRDPYHGPGINNTNMILAKNFNLDAEGVKRLQLRMESDNVFNHTQFSNPTSTYGSGTFGQITSAASARQTQLAAKFYF